MRRYLTTGLALSIIVFLGSQARAQTIIDNFSLPAQGGSGTDYLTITGGLGSSNNLVQSGTDAIGGTRVYYGIKTNSDPAAFQLGITATQEYRQVANPVTAGNSKLLYGYSAVNTAALDANDYINGAHTFNSLNLDATGTTGVSMVYGLGGNASTGTVTVSLISGTTGGTQQLANVTLPIVSASNAPLLFSSAAFLANNGSLNFADIDQVVVSINGVPAGTNFSVDNITFAAVPEPTSLAMIGLTAVTTAAGLYFRRRHSRRQVLA